MRAASKVPPNKSLQGTGIDKVFGRGRREGVLEQVSRARVLKRTRPAAERGCWADRRTGADNFWRLE